MEENDIEIFDISVPITNEDEFFRACLATEYSKYFEKTAQSNGLKLKSSEIQKVFFRQFNNENISKEKCVKELYRIRLSEYQHKYIPSGYKPTRQQKKDIRSVLESELAKTAELKTDLPKLPQNFVSRYLLQESKMDRFNVGSKSLKNIYADVCNRYGMQKEKKTDSEVSRRQFVKLGLGLGTAVLGGTAINALVSKPKPKLKSEHKNNHIPQSLVQIDDNSTEGKFKRAISMIYENPKLFSKLGLSYIVGDKFTEYINQTNRLADGWQPSEEEKNNFDMLRETIVDMITTMKLDSAVDRSFFQSPGYYEITANDRAVAQVNFEINGEEYEFTDTDIDHGSHLASTKAYRNLYMQKQNSPFAETNPSEHDNLDSAVYQAVAFALSDIDLNLDTNEITETPNEKLVDEIINNTRQNSPER